MAEDVVLVGGARTPFCEWVGGKRGDGKPGGLLKTVSAQELGSIAIKGALEKTNTAPENVDHVVMGYALQTCSQSIYGARHAGLKAGIPQEVPMLTLSRICGSGIQSIVTGAQMIMLDEASTVVAGGMENLSQAPHVLRGARDGWKLGRSPPVEDYMMTNLQDMTCGKFMAQTSDEICALEGVTREETDAFAARSHQRTLASIENGVFDEEIVDVVIKSRRGEKVITAKDEDHVVRDTSPESLSKLPTAFGPDSLVTAGNASGINDGAAAVVLMTAEEAKKRDLSPLAKIVSWAVCGVDPAIMGTGPIPASKLALKKAGWGEDQLNLVEANEAFAAQAISVNKELGFTADIVNVNGGAIALGHPIGASGARGLVTLLHEMQKRKAKKGLATLCIGGGMGVAMCVERNFLDQK